MPDSKPAGHDDEAVDAAPTGRAEDDWPQLSPLELAVCLLDDHDRRRRRIDRREQT